MSFLDQIHAATNQDFINRVQQAAIKTSIAVSSEAASGDAVLDSARRTYSNSVLRDPQKYARLMAYGVASAGITSSDADSDIETAVISMWNAYAGVNPHQTS